MLKELYLRVPASGCLRVRPNYKYSSEPDIRRYVKFDVPTKKYR